MEAEPEEEVRKVEKAEEAAAKKKAEDEAAAAKKKAGDEADVGPSNEASRKQMLSSGSQPSP